MKKVVITVAENMSADTYAYICDGFRRNFGEDCEFRRLVDNHIIGGFIANVNGEIFDLSIASQLQQMKKHIAG